MYEIVSGNIAEGVQYQVVGGTSIVYNSIPFPAGSYFVGVDGITTYTKTAGTEIVTEASSFTGISLEIKSDFFLGNFIDESSFEGISTEIGEIAYYPENYTTEEIIQNDKNFINAETKIVVPYLIDEITSIVGNTLFNGVTYDELIALEAAHSEISLVIETPDNIQEININGIKILIDITK